jgi:hypothetical protein
LNTSSAVAESEQTAATLSVGATADPQMEWPIGYNQYVWFTWDGLPLNGHTQCSYFDMGRIRDALSSAMESSVRCIRKTNSEAAKKLDDMTANGKITIGCELGDAPAYAQYRAVALTELRHISINKADLKTLFGDHLRELIFHELLHIAEFPVNPATHDDGDDQLYSCARYCSGCLLEGINGAPEHSSVDCARCADSPERKKSCGFKIVWPFGLPENTQPWCNRTESGSMEFLCYQTSRIPRWLLPSFTE